MLVEASLQGDRTFRPVHATVYINSESVNRQLPAHKPHPTNTHTGWNRRTTSTVSAQPFSPSDRVLNVDHTTPQIRVPTLDIQLREYKRAAILYSCDTYTA